MTLVAHFNKIIRVPQSSYGKEGNVDFTRDHIRLIDPDLLWIEPQLDSGISVELEELKGVPWKIDNELFSNAKRNLLFQLHSLSRVHEMLMLASLAEADAYMLLRADLQYLEDIDPAFIEEKIQKDGIDLVTPDWQRWGGLNDRFSFLSGRALTNILNRRRLVGEFSRIHGYIHAEELLHFAAEKAGLTMSYVPYRAERVRGNGRVQFEPFDPN